MRVRQTSLVPSGTNSTKTNSLSNHMRVRVLWERSWSMNSCRNDGSSASRTPQAFASRMVERSRERLYFLARQGEDWWLTIVPFFDVKRERIWIFWRRLLHTAHHRAQLGVYLRMLNKSVPSVYGPTADVRWEGADPTSSVAAASRK